MQILPYVGETVVSSDTVSIALNPADRDRADDLVLRTSAILAIHDQPSYGLARAAAGQLKGMLNEISDSEKSATRPFTAIVNTIKGLARDVGASVKAEHDRILRLCATYVKELEKEEAERREKVRQAQLEAEQRIIEARRAAHAARTEHESTLAQINLARAELDNAKIKAASELDDVQKSLVPGGRLNHPWKFELVDPEAAIAAGHKRLLRIDLDLLACLDAVKAQLANDPDKIPELPGIKVSRETKVYIKATAHAS